MVSHDTTRVADPSVSASLPNPARADSTYSYSPDRSRGPIPTLALPHLRAGMPRSGVSPAALELTAGPHQGTKAEGDQRFESISLRGVVCEPRHLHSTPGERERICRGTEGSNPSPSSRESERTASRPAARQKNSSELNFSWANSAWAPRASGSISFFHEGFRDDSLSVPLPRAGPPVIGNQTIPSPTGTPTSRPGCSLPLAQPDASGK